MLFGHQHNDASQPAPEPATADASSLNPLAIDPTTGVSLPVSTEAEAETVTSAIIQPTQTSSLDPDPVAPPPPPVPTSAPTVDTTVEQVPTTPEPATNDVSQTVPAPEAIEAPVEKAATEEPMMPFDESIDQLDAVAPVMLDHRQEPVGVSDTQVPGDDLLALKQEALAQLTPLVDKLDQTPKERFRTKMMMLQSTDNQALLKDAYEAAQQITDEKERAQALLDVINEINYFSSLNNHQ